MLWCGVGVQVSYTDDGKDWECKVCTEENVSGAPKCRVCGRDRGESLNRLCAACCVLRAACFPAVNLSAC